MRIRELAAVSLALILAACDLAPDYQPPAPPAVSSYRETGPWAPAAPADQAPRGRWWTVVRDADLDSLESRLTDDVPTLAAAVARYDQATSLARRASSDLFPTVTAGAGESHAHYPETPAHDLTAGGAVSYEVDLWGRVRNEVKAGKAGAEAGAADLAALRLSEQALLAETYLTLRGLDTELVILRQATEDYRQALDLTQQRYGGGASSELDVKRAQTQLGDVRAQYEQVSASRALLDHAIAALIGEPASSFTIAERGFLPDVPRVPVGSPSELLQRRPDIAAAERRMAAANAQIGVYRAAYFPSLTLNGAGGYESLGTAADAGASYWALGPASTLLTVFDGGRRDADVDRAKAAFEESAAAYRQTVLDAFREVEDELSLANRLADAEARQQEAADAAAGSVDLAGKLYGEGAANYLEVVVAQTAELEARRTVAQIRARRLTAAIDLVRDLGGGWTDTSRTASAAQPAP